MTAPLDEPSVPVADLLPRAFTREIAFCATDVLTVDKGRIPEFADRLLGSLDVLRRWVDGLAWRADLAEAAEWTAGTLAAEIGRGGHEPGQALRVKQARYAALRALHDLAEVLVSAQPSRIAQKRSLDWSTGGQAPCGAAMKGHSPLSGPCQRDP